MVLGEEGDMAGGCVHGTKGDLMVSGSNQEVQRPLWWNGCMGGWWHVEFRFLYSCHHHHLPWGAEYKDILGPGESSHFLPLHQSSPLA